jgi:hypothetical protein
MGIEGIVVKLKVVLAGIALLLSIILRPSSLATPKLAYILAKFLSLCECIISAMEIPPRRK